MRFALVGAGFIGRIHGLAVQAVNRVFGDDPLGAEATVLIEIRQFLLAIAERKNLMPDLGEAVRIARLCEAVLDFSVSGRRIDRPEEAVAHTRRKER